MAIMRSAFRPHLATIAPVDSKPLPAIEALREASELLRTVTDARWWQYFSAQFREAVRFHLEDKPLKLVGELAAKGGSDPVAMVGGIVPSNGTVNAEINDIKTCVRFIVPADWPGYVIFQVESTVCNIRMPMRNYLFKVQQ